MKKLLTALLFKFRLALLAGIGRFIILPIFRALFRHLAGRAQAMHRARETAAPAPAYARESAPRSPLTLDGEWRRVNDRRQDW